MYLPNETKVPNEGIASLNIVLYTTDFGFKLNSNELMNKGPDH